jgi:DNA modification methylase
MGAGSTGKVALEQERKFIGCDIGEKACKISKERIENY